EVKQYLDSGSLVPDDVTVRMVRQRLAEPDAVPGVILDGFPRTVAQAQALDRMLAQDGTRVAGALYVEVDREELIRRLSGRRVCSDPAQHVYHLISNPPRKTGVCDIDGTALVQRQDDQPETVRA